MFFAFPFITTTQQCWKYHYVTPVLPFAEQKYRSRLTKALRQGKKHVKNAFIKMYSTLRTIVLNVQYNSPEYSVQCSPTLDLLFRKRSYCLYLSSLISLHHVCLGKRWLAKLNEFATAYLDGPWQVKRIITGNGLASTAFPPKRPIRRHLPSLGVPADCICIPNK